MAKARKVKRRKNRGPAPADQAAPTVGLEAAFRRLANLLALALVKGESETGKVLTMTAAGYSTAEIAQLLNKRPNTVSAILYQAKKAAP